MAFQTDLKRMLGVLLSTTLMAAPGCAQMQSPETSKAQQVGITAATSGPAAWPAARKAAPGSPNVLLILTDDVGFGASSAFGGPVPTPTFDALAETGLRYNQFNTTGICSPTRAALLTGRNPHNVGMGNVTNLPTGYPGYTTSIPDAAGTIADVLGQNGYNTAMFGKSHLTPEWEMGPTGPFDRWPTGLGFDHFYGFLGADTNQFAPSLVEGTSAIEPPHDDPSYHFERDIADQTLQWLVDHEAATPDTPFFIYYATSAAHAPEQAPPEWLARFSGQFDQGWDRQREETFARQKADGVIPPDAVLTPRPGDLPAWDSLSPELQRFNSRLMEAYAAQLAYADYQIGRIVEHLRETGELENTVIIFVQGDNGASGEGGHDGLVFEQSILNHGEDVEYKLTRIDDIGGPTVYNHIAAGWGWALNTPFQWTKQIASHLGGVRNGLVISWPDGIADHGEVRSQFHFISDIAPTIYDLAGIEPPQTINGVEQLPLDGVSMRYSFDDAEVPSTRHAQIFEIMQNASMYQDGWIASTKVDRLPWNLSSNIVSGAGTLEFPDREWELYNLSEDYSQSADLAAEDPEKLREMVDLFYREAEENNVLPLHSPLEGREGVPGSAGRTHFRYSDGANGIPERLAPQLLGHSFRIDAHVVLTEADTSGVLVAQGGMFGGYAFYMQAGQLVFHYNALGPNQFNIASDTFLSEGEHVLSARFEIDQPVRGAGGVLTLLVDGQTIGQGRIGQTHSGWMNHTEGFDVGHDAITPVSHDYTSPESAFQGTLSFLTVDLE